MDDVDFLHSSFHEIPLKKYLPEYPDQKYLFHGMIGQSQAMRNVFEQIREIAPKNTPVLVKGESGTGKQLVVDALHRLSKRNQAPFVTIHCGSIPDELLEAELFGHEDAPSEENPFYKGKIETANGGSLLLDDIGKMKLPLQTRLSRLLEGRDPNPFDVRIMTTTDENLAKATEEGRFATTLYYQLNKTIINLASLSERKEDIPLLISFFLKRYANNGRNMPVFEEDALKCLVAYDWPRNVRELEGLVERLSILREGMPVKAAHLPEKFLKNRPIIDLPEEGVHLKTFLSSIEASLISQALSKSGGNKNQAARMLGLNRTTLIEKMKKKGLI